MISVITTINHPTKAIEEISKRSRTLVVGDMKTPENWNYKNVDYISTEQQQQTDFSIRHYLEWNHYSRKNIGYLLAIKNGTDLIYDTDDDNIPNDRWHMRNISATCSVYQKEGWANVYSVLADYTTSWPRGFSLKHVCNNEPPTITEKDKTITSPIQQGLYDGEPDVDAIYRLTVSDPVKFIENESVSLSPGSWCPFNSQSTWWFKEAFPLLYLPVNASFRMTDIWRSFVAQRCLWEMGYGVVFHSPAEVYQERNPHDLIKDLEQEVPGYLNNHRIAEILTDLKLKGDVFENLYRCYEAICDAGILPQMEMRAVNAWIKDVKGIWIH